MRKELTVYCITRDGCSKSFIGIADNSIPLKFVHSYSDVEKSIFYETSIEKDLITELKEICKDTGKTAILNSNHSNSTIQYFTRTVIGHDVTWLDYPFCEWKDFMDGVEQYCETKECVIEMDHPIDLRNEVLGNIVSEGKAVIEAKIKEIDEVRRSYRELKNNGK